MYDKATIDDILIRLRRLEARLVKTPRTREKVEVVALKRSRVVELLATRQIARSTAYRLVRRAIDSGFLKKQTNGLCSGFVEV